MSLVMLFLASFAREPFHFYKEKIEQLKRVEYDRIAAWTFTEIKEQLLKNQIKWSQIPPLKEETKPITLAPVDLQIPFFPQQKVTRRYSLETHEEKHHKDGKIYRLIAIHLQIGEKKHQFTYRLTVFKN